MFELKRIIFSYIFFGMLISQIGCSNIKKSIRCIEIYTAELQGDEIYYDLRSSFDSLLSNDLISDKNLIIRESSKHLLFNELKTKALVISLALFEKKDGHGFGYSTIYTALFVENEWVFDKKNNPNFLLSINEKTEKYELTIAKLEEYTLGRLISDGLMNNNGCGINEDYINNRW